MTLGELKQPPLNTTLMGGVRAVADYYELEADCIKGISKNCDLAPSTYENPLWCIDLRSIASINKVDFRCALKEIAQLSGALWR